MKYRSTKTYGHEQGLSCCFRQWRAASHCNRLHGYAIAVSLVFEADELDDRNWVVDFGGLKSIKAWLANTFDHTTIVASDDPEFALFDTMHKRGLIRMVVAPATGCEMFARYVFEHVAQWLIDNGLASRVRVVSCEVREHGANSALCIADDARVASTGRVVPTPRGVAA